jgi:preprotein translocase subunit SecA
MNRAGIDKIAALKVEVEGIEDIDKREEFYEEMDALEKKPMRYLKRRY